jgi:hypothetical protein
MDQCAFAEYNFEPAEGTTEKVNIKVFSFSAEKKF